MVVCSLYKPFKYLSLVVSSDLTEMSDDDSDTEFLLCNETIENVSDTEVLVFDNALDGCTEFPPDTTSYLQETVSGSSPDPNIVDTQCGGSGSLTAGEELHELITAHWLTPETSEDGHTSSACTDSNSGDHESAIHTKEDMQPSTSGYSAMSSMSKKSESSARLMPPPSVPRAPRSQVSGKDSSIKPNPEPQSTVDICPVCGSRVNKDER